MDELPGGVAGITAPVQSRGAGIMHFGQIALGVIDVPDREPVDAVVAGVEDGIDAA